MSKFSTSADRSMRAARQARAALTALGRSGVPVYVLHVPGKPAVVLSEILRKDELGAALSGL